MRSRMLLLLAVLLAVAAAADTAWVRRYNGPGNDEDYATAIGLDGSGNVYVTGYGKDSVALYDYATIKYNPSGVQQWVQRYVGPSGYDNAYALAVDGSGNTHVTGMSLGSGTLSDFATVKYNTSGVQQWVQRYDGPANDGDAANAIAVDGSGNVYVAGRSTGSGTGFDYATIKYNSSGAQQWVMRYDGPASDTDCANAIAVDGSGNVYVSGYSRGSGTNYDYATVKYNSSGAQQWVMRYDGPASDTDCACAIAVDGSGNAYVTGYSRGSGTNCDYATIKYNSDGDQQWVTRYNGPVDSTDMAKSIAIDGAGSVCVTGYSIGSGTNFDYATIKYNSDGVQQWVMRYDGPGNGSDEPYVIAVDGSGNVSVTGKSFGSGSDWDYATIEYNSSGTQQWVHRYNGPANGVDCGTAIALDGSANVYVTGFSYGSGTGPDYATLKITPGPGIFRAHFRTLAGVPTPAETVIVSDGVTFQGFANVTDVEAVVGETISVRYRLPSGDSAELTWFVNQTLVPPGGVTEWTYYKLDTPQVRVRPYILGEETGANATISWTWDGADSTVRCTVYTALPGQKVAIGVFANHLEQQGLPIAYVSSRGIGSDAASYGIHGDYHQDEGALQCS